VLNVNTHCDQFNIFRCYRLFSLFGLFFIAHVILVHSKGFVYIRRTEPNDTIYFRMLPCVITVLDSEVRGDRVLRLMLMGERGD